MIADRVFPQADTAEHRRYVDDGGCPYVTASKTWCNGVAGHGDSHWATEALPDGTTKRRSFGLTWGVAR